MIEFEHVVKEYNGVSAVDDISLELPAGKICVFIGPSGCGKTTSLRLINRMIEPSSGTIRLDGTPVSKIRAEELRRGIGYVIQSVGLLPHMSVRENIGIVPRLLGWDKHKRDTRADELLELIGLSPGAYRDKLPHELSGGEAQRVGVARALAADPPVLLMDEPFGAVDPLGREVLQREFLSLNRELKKTVVFVTHDLDEAIRLGDRIVLMRSGKVVQDDIPERILGAPRNEFVREFVGADRALKRLSCFTVESHMHKAAFLDRALLQNGRPPEDMQVNGTGMLWIVDAGEVLVGMCRRSGGKWGDVREVRAEELGVTTVSSLRDALSRLLGRGLKAVPVLSDDHRLVGEVRLTDIEAVNQSDGYV